jgi:tetratricopeptide (TPR) repeat protein
MVQIKGQTIPLPAKNRRRKTVTALLAAFFVMLSQPICGETVKNDKLDAADDAFSSMHYEKADSLYHTLVKAGDQSPALYWKLARLNISMAEAIPPGEREKRMPFYNDAVKFARKAVQIDSTNASAHTWLAAALAVKADKIGSKEKLNRAAEIKRELDKALELNPNDDIAWSLLGSYNFEASKIGWFSRFMGGTFVGKMPKGTREEAENDFKKAISLNPRVIRHYHELALLYIEDGRKQEALNTLRMAETRPVYMKSDMRRLKEIRHLIKKLSKELEEK